MKSINDYIIETDNVLKVQKQNIIRERLSIRKNSNMVVEGLLSNIAKRIFNKSKNAAKNSATQVFGKFAEKGKKTLEWLNGAAEKLQKTVSNTLNNVMASIDDDKKRLAFCTALDYAVKCRYYTAKLEALVSKYDFPKEWTEKFNKDLDEYSYKELESAVKSMKDTVLST